MKKELKFSSITKSATKSDWSVDGIWFMSPNVTGLESLEVRSVSAPGNLSAGGTMYG